MQNFHMKGLAAGLALLLPIALMNTASSASHGVAVAPMAVAEKDMAKMPMHEQMGHMRTMMGRMQNATSPAERHELMQKHMASMQGMMKMMHGMMAGQSMIQSKPGMGMMGPGQFESPSAKDHEHGSNTSGAMPREGQDGATRMMMMEERLNMMQMMMDQMLQNQDALLKGKKQDN